MLEIHVMIDVDVTLTVMPQCRRDVDIKQFITNVTLGSSIVTQLCDNAGLQYSIIIKAKCSNTKIQVSYRPEQYSCSILLLVNNAEHNNYCQMQSHAYIITCD